MTRYEYCLKKYDGKGLLGGKIDLTEVEADLNRMGAEGWELVSMLGTNQEMGSTRWIVATFKRVKS